MARMHKLIQPAEVQRDANGYWWHPDYPMTELAIGEFNQWCYAQGLVLHYTWLECDVSCAHTAVRNYAAGNPDISEWQPSRPPIGTHWFPLCITDTEDGPVCIWARRTQLALEIEAERQRQISPLGYTPYQDDEYKNFELSLAASCYVNHVIRFGDDYTSIHQSVAQPKRWPWAPQHWKPKSPRRDLVRAAALILAEIERIDRAEAKQS